jgi:hypothetical protein
MNGKTRGDYRVRHECLLGDDNGRTAGVFPVLGGIILLSLTSDAER